MLNKNTICLWYDGTALDAAKFYAETFPDSTVDAIHRAPADYPSGKEGDVLTVEFKVMGIPCLGLNGGATFKQTKHSLFRSQLTTKLKQIDCGMRLSKTADKKAHVAGAKINGVYRGKSHHAHSSPLLQTLITQQPSVRSKP